MKTTSINLFSSAIILSGIELLYDFSRLNLYSLQVLLVNMEFYFFKKLNENAVFLYTSNRYRNDCTTMIFLNSSSIGKVRYLNVNIEKLIGIDSLGPTYSGGYPNY